MYFTVKKYLRIGGRNYKPCISYRLSDYLFPTIKGLEAKGDAEITEKPVFFQNGSKIKPKEVLPPVAEAPAVTEEKPVEVKKNRRKNRDRTEEAVAVAEGNEDIEGF